MKKLNEIPLSQARYKLLRLTVKLRRKLLRYGSVLKNRRQRTGLVTLLFISVLFVPFNSSVNLVGALGYANKKLPIILRDGGFVKSFSVIDGQHVAKGELLAILEEPRLQAEFDGVINRTAYLACKTERLRSLSTLTAFQVPDNLLLLQPALLDGYCQSETAVRDAAFDTYTRRVAILSTQLDSYLADLKTIAVSVAQQKTKLQIQNDMLSKYKTLYKEGFISQAQYLDQQTKVIAVNQELADAQVRLTDRESKKLDIDRQLQELKASLAEQYMAEYNQTRTEFEASYAQLKSLFESNTKLAIYAPISGSVHNTTKLRPGVYVNPNETIMEIVPDDDKLVAIAQFRPADHAIVRTNQDALVRLQTHNQSFAPEFKGSVLSISPDLKYSQPNSPQVFEAFVTFDCDVSCARQNNLSAGVPVDVYVLGEKRSLFSYLMSAMIRSSNNALSEPN